LQEAVKLHRASGWKRVAEFVGGSRTTAHCRSRWNSHVRHVGGGATKCATWSEAEVIIFGPLQHLVALHLFFVPQTQELSRLVQKHTVEPYWSKDIKGMTRLYIDWKAIGEALGRVPKKCQNKWRGVLRQSRGVPHCGATSGKDSLLVESSGGSDSDSGAESELSSPKGDCSAIEADLSDADGDVEPQTARLKQTDR